MKQFTGYLSLGFTLAVTLGLCIYIGYRTGHLVIGMITGFLLDAGYLYNMIKNADR